MGSARQVMLSLEVTKIYVQNGCPMLKIQKGSSVSILTSLSGLTRSINPSLRLTPGTLMLGFFLRVLKTFLSSRPWANQLFLLCFPKRKRDRQRFPAVDGGCGGGSSGTSEAHSGCGMRSRREWCVSEWSYTQAIARSHLKMG